MTQFVPKNFAELTQLMDDIVGDKTPVNVTAAGTTKAWQYQHS